MPSETSCAHPFEVQRVVHSSGPCSVNVSYCTWIASDTPSVPLGSRKKKTSRITNIYTTLAPFPGDPPVPRSSLHLHNEPRETGNCLMPFFACGETKANPWQSLGKPMPSPAEAWVLPAPTLLGCR